MVQDLHDRALKGSPGRHFASTVGDPVGASQVYTTPHFLKMYKAECKRMRTFIREGDLMRRSIGKVAKILRPPMADEEFCNLLVAENLATLPRTLVARVLHDISDLAASGADNRASPVAIGGGQLFGGITPEVIELFQDCHLPPEIFGVLRKLAPARQIEVAKLMIAMNRVNSRYAKMAVALSSQSQLADSSNPGWKFARLTDMQLAALRREFAGLCNRFRNTMEHYGTLALERISAGKYLDHLLENVRVVRYLAQKFPETLSEIQAFIEPRTAG